MRNHIRRVRGWLPIAKDHQPRVRALVRWIGWMAITTAIVAIIVVALFLLPPLIAPELPDDARAQFEVRDRARLTVASIIGGLILLAGVWMNWRRVTALEKQVAAAQLGQITERFTRAIDQLGAVRPDNAVAPEIRAGGVRSLERIARESEDDFWPVLDILSAYLRSVSRAPDSDHLDELAAEAREIHERMDVASTIEAITRLWPTERTANYRPLNLMGAFVPRLMLTEKHLQGADLTRAYLEEADLSGSNLEDARLGGANLKMGFLRGANLRVANLEGATLPLADLSYTNLEGAYFGNADLEAVAFWWATLSGANFRSANLEAADLGTVNAEGANFTGANLQGANLRRAKLRVALLRNANLRYADLSEADLRGMSLDGATYDEQTRWPEGFTPEQSD